MKLYFFAAQPKSLVLWVFLIKRKERKLQYLWYHNFRSYLVEVRRLELRASWSQTRRSTKLSQSGICSRHAAAILQVTGLQEKRMLSSYAVTLSVKRPHRGLNPESPDRQSGGISNYPMRPLYILACASSIYPQIYTRILLAIKRKPNGQGEIRTHNVSSVTVLQTACFSHFAYLP